MSSNQRSGTGDLVPWTVAGTVLQIAMIMVGHYNDFVKNNLFAIGGMTISLIAGLFYVRAAMPTTKGAAALGGGAVGGLSALIGIAVSIALGDTQAMVLTFGTVSSFVTGLIGGLVGRIRTRSQTQPL